MEQPLDGVRVLDLSRMLAGDYASMLLGDLGAEVIKIEEPESGDPLRKMPPHFIAGESAYFLSINRNKKSVTLDLTKEAGREIFYRLTERSDIVFDNFRPGILEKLGVDYDTLKECNPQIISCSISSYGQTGPYREYPGFDLVIQAYSGAMSYTGEPGRVPVRMGIPMGDLAGSLFAVYSIASALYARELTGEGRRIDLSLLDCLISLHTYVAQYYFASGETPQLIGSGHQSVVPYRAYRTKDGFITIAVFVEKFWALLCKVIGEPQLASDLRYNSTTSRLKNRQEVDSLLENKFVSKTTQEWMTLLEREGVPAAPVNTLDMVFKDPQVLAREMVVEVEHPKCGKLKMLGNPVKQPEVESQPLSPTPLLGEHTEQVLRDVLALSPDEISALKKECVI
jgi:crotonobetainyl-CoA:carnitine CoA-transferase CaiB-like acyl-CoA transferase